MGKLSITPVFKEVVVDCCSFVGSVWSIILITKTNYIYSWAATFFHDEDEDFYPSSCVSELTGYSVLVPNAQYQGFGTRFPGNYLHFSHFGTKGLVWEP